MNETRRANIPLPPACGPEQEQRLLDRLQRLDGIEAVTRGRDAVQVEYRFPELDYSQLWQAVSAGWRLPLTARLRQGLRALLESNERERRLGGGGWHARIEAIYADLYRQQSLPRSARRLWQEYGQRKGTGQTGKDSP